MHHLTRGISSLLRSISLILFAFPLVYLNASPPNLVTVPLFSFVISLARATDGKSEDEDFDEVIQI